MNKYSAFLSILVCISILVAGCTESGSDISVDSSPNNEDIYASVNWVIETSRIDEYSIEVYHAVYDPNSELSSFGYDLDLDGVIDVTLEQHSNYTTVTTDGYPPINSTTTNRTALTIAFVLELSNGFVASEMIYLPQVLEYVPLEYRNLEIFDFSLEVYEPSASNSDNIARIVMENGLALNWEHIGVSLTTDNQQSIRCNPQGDTNSTSACSYTEWGNSSDDIWSVGDGLTINENSADLCSEDCNLTIRLFDVTLNLTLSELSHERIPSNPFTSYSFSAVDSNGAPSTATDDNLIRVTMDQGSDLNWASVSVSISVNGAAPITCSNPGLDGADCSAIEFGDTSDNVWSVGDGITIAESGQDLCSEGTCEVEVRIIDTREGATIDTASAIAQ